MIIILNSSDEVSFVPTISTEVLKRNFTTTPKAIGSHLEAFCRQISHDHIPVYVPVTVEPYAAISECFNNVTSKVERDGGTPIYGWLIWEWPEVFVEAEHHAVWAKDGKFIDITPHVNGEQRVLFLPDPARVYDFVKQRRLINIKASRGNFASVDRWIAASDKLQQAIEENSIGKQVTLERSFISAIGLEIQSSLGSIIVEVAKTKGPNSTCLCTSGRKFKKCCSPLIQLFP